VKKGELNKICAGKHFIEVRKEDNLLTIDYSIKNISGETSIKIPSRMQEWNIAMCPAIYKNIAGNRIVIMNLVVLDLVTNKWFIKGAELRQFEIEDNSVQHIFKTLYIPDFQKTEILKIMDTETIEEITLETITQRIIIIPVSTDVSKWRINSTSDNLATDFLWREINFFEMTSSKKISDKVIAIRAYKHYQANCQWYNSEIRRIMAERKVILPLQVPLKLDNFEVIVLTSTPQNEKCGKIAEIAIGAEFDEYGYITKTPEKAYSITSIQCPFPQRLSPQREVVLCAISQALSLRNAEKPLVKFKEIQ
jgi:hypothetical protein